MGSGIGGTNSESGQYIAAIKQIDPNAEVIDLKVHQQNDGSSCGAFTAENLIALAGLKQINLTPEKARELLATIKNAQAIRLSHLNSSSLSNLLGQNGALNEAPSKEEEINTAIEASNNTEVVNIAALQEISNLALVTNDRLSNFYLMDHVSGYSSGDEELNYGAWIKGSFGSGIYKSSKINNETKSTSTGVSLGVDGKVDEDITLGIAVSLNQNKLKSQNKANAINNFLYNNSYITHIQSIIGSLYGSFLVNDYLTVNANIGIGKLTGKTNYKSQSINNSSIYTKDSNKIKGDILGGSLAAHSYLLIQSFMFIPSFGISYEQIKMAGMKQENISTNKISIRKFNFIPGLAISKVFEFKDLRFIPEITAVYTISSLIKSSKIIVKNNSGITLNNTGMSLNKNVFNFGGNVTFAGNILELNLGYERIMQKKYQGQVGYIKLRVNF